MAATRLDDLFDTFLRERKYLQNLRPSTLEWHSSAWKAFRSATRSLNDPGQLTRGHLEQFIYSLRDRGLRPVTCNTWLRSINAFCRWLQERGDLPVRVHMKTLKVEKRLVQTLDVGAIQTL